VGAPVKDDTGTLLTLAANFALMSLFAVGGANAALPEMHRLAVEVCGPSCVFAFFIGGVWERFAGASSSRLVWCRSRSV
jgi:hypothetical protein